MKIISIQEALMLSKHQQLTCCFMPENSAPSSEIWRGPYNIDIDTIELTLKLIKLDKMHKQD